MPEEHTPAASMSSEKLGTERNMFHEKFGSLQNIRGGKLSKARDMPRTKPNAEQKQLSAEPKRYFTNSRFSFDKKGVYERSFLFGTPNAL